MICQPNNNCSSVPCWWRLPSTMRAENVRNHSPSPFFQLRPEHINAILVNDTTRNSARRECLKNFFKRDSASFSWLLLDFILWECDAWRCCIHVITIKDLSTLVHGNQPWNYLPLASVLSEIINIIIIYITFSVMFYCLELKASWYIFFFSWPWLDYTDRN